MIQSQTSSQPAQTVVETPTQTIVRKANETHEIIDSLGRRIKIRKPGILDETKLIDLLGDSAKNIALMNYYPPLIYVSSIDDVPLFLGTTRRELDAALARLDREGIKAVGEGIQKYFSDMLVTSEEDAKDQIKK